MTCNHVSNWIHFIGVYDSTEREASVIAPGITLPPPSMESCPWGTGIFDAWLTSLKDARGKARIAERIRSAERGNFGDCEPVGDGVSEMRIHFGPGYRVYITRTGEVVYVLLCGGSKRGQRRDIIKAKNLARALKEV